MHKEIFTDNQLELLPLVKEFKKEFYSGFVILRILNTMNLSNILLIHLRKRR